MFYQRWYVRQLLRKSSEGTTTPDEVIELQAALKVFTEEDILGMMGEYRADCTNEVSSDEILSAIPEALLVIARSHRPNREQGSKNSGSYGKNQGAI